MNGRALLDPLAGADFDPLAARPAKRCCMRGVTTAQPRSARCTKAAFAVMNVANAA